MFTDSSDSSFWPSSVLGSLLCDQHNPDERQLQNHIRIPIVHIVPSTVKHDLSIDL